MDSQNRDIFQYAMIGLFCILAVLAVIVFSNIQARNSGERAQYGDVVIWGTKDRVLMEELFKMVEKEVPAIGRVTYTQVDDRNFYGTFLEAASIGRGPDLVLIDQSQLYLYADKSIVIPYTTFPELNFKANYIEGAEAFLRTDGVLAVPFTIDPFVMFWNRDMFTNAGLAQPPSYWDELDELTTRLNRVDANLNIQKSLIAFGEAQNVAHFKHILALLMLQSGVRITQWDAYQLLRPALSQTSSGREPPAVAALRFYTDFSNPSSRRYSWNRSLPEARAAFTAGDLALYIGRLSEVHTITRLNPNLNFDIALVPQVRGTERRVTNATIDAFVIPLASRNSAGAYGLAVRLASAPVQHLVGEKFGLPPIRRDLLSRPQPSAYWAVAYDSAIISRTWLDPNPTQTTEIMRRMVEAVKSGELAVATAVSRAEAEMGTVQRQ
jgi:ABC-type glycerol-3-phosphate transport system substrate-binding protein